MFAAVGGRPRGALTPWRALDHPCRDRERGGRRRRAAAMIREYVTGAEARGEENTMTGAVGGGSDAAARSHERTRGGAPPHPPPARLCATPTRLCPPPPTRPNHPVPPPPACGFTCANQVRRCRPAHLKSAQGGQSKHDQKTHCQKEGSGPCLQQAKDKGCTAQLQGCRGRRAGFGKSWHAGGRCAPLGSGAWAMGGGVHKVRAAGASGARTRGDPARRRRAPLVPAARRVHTGM